MAYDGELKGLRVQELKGFESGAKHLRGQSSGMARLTLS